MAFGVPRSEFDSPHEDGLDRGREALYNQPRREAYNPAWNRVSARSLVRSVAIRRLVVR